ncbi:SPW repeat domain-containing protein [Halopiger djelfimassiliensis]|uniref:SPW repeat domain-containing protein n=1 Tax=Halopiger djelfimassiliensis TaxID=1293047 RepID=UPI000677753D|nr:SPW repeat protein [Halopiger djelfimassiliensis]
MSDSRSVAAASPMAQRTAGLAAGLGAWVLLSGVLFTGAGWIIVNNALVGAAIAAGAASVAAVPSGGPLPSIAAPLVVLLLGLWTVAAPFVLGVTNQPLFWSNVVAGILVAVLAGASTYGSWKLSNVTATGT